MDESPIDRDFLRAWPPYDPASVAMLVDLKAVAATWDGVRGPSFLLPTHSGNFDSPPLAIVIVGPRPARLSLVVSDARGRDIWTSEDFADPKLELSVKREEQRFSVLKRTSPYEREMILSEIVPHAPRVCSVRLDSRTGPSR